MVAWLYERHFPFTWLLYCTCTCRKPLLVFFEIISIFLLSDVAFVGVVIIIVIIIIIIVVVVVVVVFLVVTTTVVPVVLLLILFEFTVNFVLLINDIIHKYGLTNAEFYSPSNVFG